MTTLPSRGGLTDGPPRNSSVLDAACRLRRRSRRLIGALLATLTAGAFMAALAKRIDDAPLPDIHGKVRHATVLPAR